MMDLITQDLMNYEPLIRKPRRLELRSMKRVLIIEDDISLAELLMSVFDEISPDMTVDWATSGEEAEYYLQREGEFSASSPYDLVIADIFLEGDVTGLDIWKLCDRKYPDTNILVTSSLPVEKFTSCLKNEASCPPYLPKPFTLRECKEAINESL